MSKQDKTVSSALPQKYRDRIKEIRKVRASELLKNPKNWRTHPDQQKTNVRRGLEAIGKWDVLLGYDTPDGLLLLDGHLRAEDNPHEVWTVVVLDVTPDEADAILAVHDPLGQLAGRDDERLASLAEGLENLGGSIAETIRSTLSDAGLLTGEEGTKLKPLNTQPPPAMSWVLVGIPTVRFGEINQQIEQLAQVPGIVLESTVNNG